MVGLTLVVISQKVGTNYIQASSEIRLILGLYNNPLALLWLSTYCENISKMGFIGWRNQTAGGSNCLIPATANHYTRMVNRTHCQD